MNIRRCSCLSSGPRALALLLFTAALAVGCRPSGPEAAGPPEPDTWPTQGWQAVAPEAQGFDSAKLAEGLLGMQADGTRVHSLMMIRDGYALLDTTFYPYDGSTVHDLASVTKSFMTTLIGIAADQGLIDLDAPLVSYFPDRTIANLDERKQAVTIRDLVSLTSGLECNPAGDEQDLAAMRATDDWVQAALDRPSVAAPGTRFVYCGPDMHLLSGVLRQATGMTALEFARANLFGPLGITEAVWDTDPQGNNRGWGDLALLPEDAAKLGLLFLQGGKWEGKQIVSSEWVAEATKAQHPTGANWAEDYGYGWWVSREGEAVPYYSANGRGGQYVRVFPGINAIVATTGGGFSNAASVTDYLGAAIGDLEKPLPENPQGVAQLEAAVETVNRPPAAQPVPPQPEMASAISGRTYTFEPSPMPIESVRFEFDESEQAIFYLKVGGEQATREFPVGLDGVYRIGLREDGLMQGARGAWSDADTFVVDYDEIAGIDAWTMTLDFQDDAVKLQMVSPSTPGLFKLQGRAE